MIGTKQFWQLNLYVSGGEKVLRPFYKLLFYRGKFYPPLAGEVLRPKTFLKRGWIS